MSIKLYEAAEFYKELKHQKEAWDWLQQKVEPTTLEEFSKKYRAVEASTKTYSNTWDGVYAAAKDTGAKFPELVAAQWALESAWGSSPSGKNNYFGQKGEGSNLETKECIDGTWVTITDGFIDFPDLKTSVKYLVDRWYKNYKTYKGVNNAPNCNAAANQLKAEGYATDPDYPAKLIQVMDSKLKAPENNVPKQNPLPVIYMSQRDNYRDASRTCFSSSCAMMLKYLKPTAIKGDNDYVKVVFTYGDSTDSTAQLKTLFHFGLETKFYTKGTPELIKKQIDANKPVPVGFLHHGSASYPTGNGHWLCIIGYDSSGYWVNDPWGECDLITGEYISQNGAKLHYSYKNFNPRWLVDGPNSGWCMVA